MGVDLLVSSQADQIKPNKRYEIEKVMDSMDFNPQSNMFDDKDK